MIHQCSGNMYWNVVISDLSEFGPVSLAHIRLDRAYWSYMATELVHWKQERLCDSLTLCHRVITDNIFCGAKACCKWHCVKPLCPQCKCGHRASMTSGFNWSKLAKVTMVQTKGFITSTYFLRSLTSSFILRPVLVCTNLMLSSNSQTSCRMEEALV